MMDATGWQPHSVRGVLAGVVRRRLKLRLVSEKIDGQRVYRIVDGGDDHVGMSPPTSRSANEPVTGDEPGSGSKPASPQPGPTDLPPLKWSSLKYVLTMEDEINGEEAAYTR
jgi:hypothetical protein